MARELEMQHPASVVVDNYKNVEQPDARRKRYEEVAGGNSLDVVSYEVGPTLIAARPTRPTLGHVFAYSARQFPKAKLEHQVAGYAPFLRRRVLICAMANELSQLPRDVRASRS